MSNGVFFKINGEDYNALRIIGIGEVETSFFKQCSNYHDISTYKKCNKEIINIKNSNYYLAYESIEDNRYNDNDVIPRYRFAIDFGSRIAASTWYNSKENAEIAKSHLMNEINSILKEYNNII